MLEFINELLDAHQGFIVATLAGITSIIVAIITTWAMRRKNAADVASQLTDMALSLIEPLQEEIDALKKEQSHLDTEVVKLKAENALLHRWSQLLFSQVVELGSDPIPFAQVQKWSE